MGKKGLKIIKNQTKEERSKQRKKLGTLKSLTVQPKTRDRYNQGLDRFWNFLAQEHIELPRRRDAMDGLVGDYLEYLWGEGEGRATASNFLAALQDYDPKLKNLLPLSWRLMKAWSTNEVPVRAPPLTEPVLRAMVGWAFFYEHYTFGLSLLVGFYGLLRTGELLALQAWQVHMTSGSQPAVLNLGLTKAGKRQGAAESVTISELSVVQLLWKWKAQVSPYEFLTDKPHVWRNLFQTCLDNLQIQEWGFRPYSLRRGGATCLFIKVGSLDRVLLMGRWTAIKTAKIYLNSGLAMLADIQIPTRLLRPFHLTYFNFLSSDHTLELALKSRSGGRGSEPKKAKMAKKLAKKARKSNKSRPRRG